MYMGEVLVHDDQFLKLECHKQQSSAIIQAKIVRLPYELLYRLKYRGSDIWIIYLLTYLLT